MCELISICPKCRQPILCATAQFGKCVACPACLQAITMPESPGESRARTPHSHPAVSAPRVPAPVGRRGVSASAANGGGAVLVFAAGIRVLTVKKSRSTTREPSAVSPSYSTPSIRCPSRFASPSTAVPGMLSYSAPSGNYIQVPASKEPFQDAQQT